MIKKMESWPKKDENRPVTIEREGRFHLVCYSWMVDRMKSRVEDLFNVDNLSKMVNMFIWRLERFLVYHMNITPGRSWILDLIRGNPLPRDSNCTEFEPDKDGKLKQRRRSDRMTEHLYIRLDFRCYKLLKKMHEACNTFSMASLLRSIICFCLDGLDFYQGVGGNFWRWLKEWERANLKREKPKACPDCTLFSSHMLRYKGDAAVKLALYTYDYGQKAILSCHPPPLKSGN